MRPIQRVLVANRGEIAVRVIRGCHELGIEAVAVYSEPDVGALHVRVADDAYLIGPASSSASYLNVPVLLDVAKRAGCDAVHPGYGFLSENAGFARAVQKAGLIWIGPPPDAIEAMGSKTAARKRMADAGVPVVPGTIEPLQSVAEAHDVAARVGYPVMLKASAGGGGKGMRRVDREEDLEAALMAAQSEARKSFADDAVYVEKLVVRPRHVEVQVLSDMHGHTVHLLERDCSIQRRNQKVFEETPCPVLPAATRAAMTSAAVRAAEAVGYEGAGTIEFLLDQDGSFYFLEMNTRLQVEHPITELVTGIDLVQAQLRVARGEPLWFTQDEVVHHGHAVECRVYAEDAAENFRPCPGPLHKYREPGGPFVRVDSGVVEGMEVPVHYDPLISKLAVWGRTREEALDRCRRALTHYQIVGIKTSIPFFLALLDDPSFRDGVYATDFIKPEWLARLVDDAGALPPDVALAALVIARLDAERPAEPPAVAGGAGWRRPGRWRDGRGGV
jgi:acetyl-CoA carboxylase biotin carboxylase subunit